MIYTSYFANKNIPKGTRLVSIARSQPKWGPKLPEVEELLPPWDLIYDYKQGVISEEDYILKYAEQLVDLDPNALYQMLDGSILLCWERPDKFCHRHLVAKWFRTFGLKVQEYGISLF